MSQDWYFLRNNPVAKSSISYSPRGDRVIVKRTERERVEPTGITLPDSQQRPLNSGTVIAVGPGARNSVTGRIDPIEDLKVGDTVEFLDYAGTGIEIDGQEYLCMRENEIHGKR
jgi:chaperonin GroES